ncbi:MAG: sulfatase-like hydrolase/transferase, partial [Vicinamibacteraceae bacterium]
MTDDQGWAQLGVHGDDVLKTPNLDRLASESVELTRFYVSPVCAPTRASLMTGRYNYRTGVVDTWLGRAMMHPDEVTLAEMLGTAGYRTGIFGKWHLGDNYPMRPVDQGFDEALVHRGGGIEQPSDPPGSGYFDPILQHNGLQEQHEGYCTDVFFDGALRFIEQTRDRPYFLYLATNAPHAPYEVPDEYRQRYATLGLDDKDARIYGMITN